MKKSIKNRISEKALSASSLVIPTWSDERLMDADAYTSLVNSFGLSVDSAKALVENEMRKRGINYG